jgi:hypothetical protein
VGTEGGKGNGFKRIELDDVEGHMAYKSEDLSDQEVTVSLQDGAEVQGHAYRIRFEDTTGEDTEGHAVRIKGIPASPLPRSSLPIKLIWALLILPIAQIQLGEDDEVPGRRGDGTCRTPPFQVTSERPWKSLKGEWLLFVGCLWTTKSGHSSL